MAQLQRNSAPVCPTSGHPMRVATLLYSGTDAYICNLCRLSKTGSRWNCVSCSDDYCPACSPLPPAEIRGKCTRCGQNVTNFEKRQRDHDRPGTYTHHACMLPSEISNVPTAPIFSPYVTSSSVPSSDHELHKTIKFSCFKCKIQVDRQIKSQLTQCQGGSYRYQLFSGNGTQCDKCKRHSSEHLGVGKELYCFYCCCKCAIEHGGWIQQRFDAEGCPPCKTRFAAACAAAPLKAQLISFYKLFNPEKLDDCESVARFHLDKQDELNKKLMATYGHNLYSLPQLEQAELICQQGNSCLVATPDRAAELYSQALQIWPNKPEYHYNRGLAFTNACKYQQALQDFEYSMQLKPYPQTVQAVEKARRRVEEHNAAQKKAAEHRRKEQEQEQRRQAAAAAAKQAEADERWRVKAEAESERRRLAALQEEAAKREEKEKRAQEEEQRRQAAAAAAKQAEADERWRVKAEAESEKRRLAALQEQRRQAAAAKQSEADELSRVKAELESERRRLAALQEEAAKREEEENQRRLAQVAQRAAELAEVEARKVEEKRAQEEEEERRRKQAEADERWRVKAEAESERQRLVALQEEAAKREEEENQRRLAQVAQRAAELAEVEARKAEEKRAQEEEEERRRVVAESGEASLSEALQEQLTLAGLAQTMPALVAYGVRTEEDCHLLQEADLQDMQRSSGLKPLDRKKLGVLIQTLRTGSGPPSPAQPESDGAVPTSAAVPKPPAAGEDAAAPPDAWTDDVKFAVTKLILGPSSDSALGLRAALGLHDKALGPKLENGLKAVQEEFYTYGTPEDHENFDYVVYGVARQEKVPEHVKKQVQEGKYHGGALSFDAYDRGHDGMTLQDLTNHPSSQAARLSQVEVACLRLYTTSSYRNFNKPLRYSVCPHPWAMTVYHASEAVRKLRGVAATLHPKTFNKITYLYRGMRNMTLDFDEFEELGGTEKAFMSTTSEFAVARSYSESNDPLIFKYKTRGLAKGCSIKFLSVFPDEEEYLYPPLTYLQPEEAPTQYEGATVICITPQMA